MIKQKYFNIDIKCFSVIPNPHRDLSFKDYVEEVTVYAFTHLWNIFNKFSNL